MGREKRGQEVPGYPRWWELGEIGKKGTNQMYGKFRP